MGVRTHFAHITNKHITKGNKIVQYGNKHMVFPKSENLNI